MTQTPHLPTLPLHLMIAIGSWLSSPLALQPASSASQSSKGAAHPLENLTQALQSEAASRAHSLLSGIARYLALPPASAKQERPVLWQQGSARLLDYSLGGTGPCVLFVPSLINRYYILDLEEGRSMLDHLAQAGLRPAVLDWGTPGKAESRYDCEAYIQQILIPAIKHLHKLHGQRIILAGYCMGGVLSLAAAKLARRYINGLALLATPWDFHCPEFSPYLLEHGARTHLKRLLEGNKPLSGDVIQALFYLTAPWVFADKYIRYSQAMPESRAAKDFAALERWVNDGVPMTAPVARECLLGWAQKNTLYKGGWDIAGKAIKPASLSLPCFVALPRNDHVVPYACALPLAESLRHAHIIRPGSGHVGMIVGSRARRELWQPLAEWIWQVA